MVITRADDTSTYRLLKGNPTRSVQTQNNDLVKKMFEQKFIDITFETISGIIILHSLKYTISLKSTNKVLLSAQLFLSVMFSIKVSVKHPQLHTT